jgi:L-ribulose-5-phosphate 4-epimerase
VLEQLKEQVCEANHALVREGLVTLTWGNASAIDADRQHVVIKPSGVSYAEMSAKHMVVVDLEGNVVDGELKPSSDTPTHLHLYHKFPGVGGIVHTHSTWATAFAQARVAIPCLGTTHADHFMGPVPVTRPLNRQELDAGYEHYTGEVVVERFHNDGIEPLEVPAVLLAGHAPFTWGKNIDKAVQNAVALEAVAEMAHHTLTLRPGLDAIMQAARQGMGLNVSMPELEDYVLDKHYQRKHGPNAYYGQA